MCTEARRAALQPPRRRPPRTHARALSAVAIISLPLSLASHPCSSLSPSRSLPRLSLSLSLARHRHCARSHAARTNTPWRIASQTPPRTFNLTASSPTNRQRHVVTPSSCCHHEHAAATLSIAFTVAPKRPIGSQLVTASPPAFSPAVPAPSATLTQRALGVWWRRRRRLCTRRTHCGNDRRYGRSRRHRGRDRGGDHQSFLVRRGGLEVDLGWRCDLRKHSHRRGGWPLHLGQRRVEGVRDGRHGPSSCCCAGRQGCDGRGDAIAGVV